MRIGSSEKLEIIRIVEESELSARKTLVELGIPRSTFYNWYRRYLEYGPDGLLARESQSKRFWNKIPDEVKETVVEKAKLETELSPLEFAFKIIDTEGYFISESSVYRILKSYDLITSPAYILMSAGNSFSNPTKRVNEMWQTDFTYFKVVGWGWYYLSSILDDFSHFIIAWELCTTMAAGDVQSTLNKAIAFTGVDQVKVKHRPRLLSDNGPCYLSGQLAEYMERRDMKHVRGAPYHPMTQGKIERYHRTMKNIVKLQHYYFPWELEQEISKFVEHYNHHRYHESLNNVAPADVFYGRHREILSERDRVKRKTMQERRRLNLINPSRSAKGSLVQI
jgi:putative transposase